MLKNGELSPNVGSSAPGLQKEGPKNFLEDHLALMIIIVDPEN